MPVREILLLTAAALTLVPAVAHADAAAEARIAARNAALAREGLGWRAA